MDTIRESFDKCLPSLPMRTPGQPGTGSWEIPAINPLSSTDGFDAPKALEPVHPVVYLNMAAAALSRFHLHHTIQLPAVEDSIYLGTEGDVVRAVSLYLIHPVNMALQATGSSISCRSELTHGPSARTDIIWMSRMGNKRVTLGVLELKNTQLLVKAHFDQGLADMAAGTKSSKHPKNMLSEAFSGRAPNPLEHTFLGSSTSRVSRQARKYHQEAETDFVAVFDWCSMIIFDFGGMDEGRQKLAKGTWHQEGPGLPPQATFRMLLLGMLIRSMRRTGIL